jgi:hypothetical protein
LIEEVLADAGKASQRERLLPAPAVAGGGLLRDGACAVARRAT